MLYAQLKDKYEKSSSGNSGLTIISRLNRPKPTIVFDTYWKFATERQNIFYKRSNKEPQPWTDDEILMLHKFTNAYRASDRTSQYLIRHVIYRGDLPDSTAEVFFRIILFKLFNKIETWKLFEATLGRITYSDYSFETYDEILTGALSSNQTIYSAAYIMPSGITTFGHQAKHRNNLKLLEKMMHEDLPHKLATIASLENSFNMLLNYPTIGQFLAYQFAIDVNYSEITNFSEMEFVMAGPGAKNGIRKCFSDFGDFSETDIIKFVTDIQESEFARLDLNFKFLRERPLQLIDCQNLFCEVDKYSRVKHPEIEGIVGRTRIKQKFLAKTEDLNYWYPPKWGINDILT
jgi:hypothetical protein